MQEQYLTQEEEEEKGPLEDKTVTSRESWGEDYWLVLRPLEKASSGESSVEEGKRRKRRLREWKIKDCTSCEVTFKSILDMRCVNTAADTVEKPVHSANNEDKHSFKNSEKAKIPKSKSQSKKSTKQSLNIKPRIRIPCDLLLLLSLCVFSVLCVCLLCQPQCCDYHSGYQIVTYTGGTLPI